MRASFLALALLFSASFAQTVDKEIKTLGTWMTGSWDTFKQVDEDEEKGTEYRHARAILHVIPVQIPELNKTGLSFYVENQLAEMRTKPYRQRIYWLFRDDKGKIRLKFFKIRNQEQFINAHKKPEVLRNLKFEMLTAEEGCDLIYEKVSEKLYRGKLAEPKACKSSLRGATYVYSESEISPDRWVNLDQGFDDVGNHKWGPPPGTIGHIFLRRN